MSKRSGTMRMRPSRTAAIAASAMPCMLQNHCGLMRGSITVRVWSTRTWKVKASKPVTSNYRSPGKTIYDTRASCVPQLPMSGFDVSYDRLFYRHGELVRKQKFTWSYNTLTPVVCGKKPGSKQD